LSLLAICGKISTDLVPGKLLNWHFHLLKHGQPLMNRIEWQNDSTEQRLEVKLPPEIKAIVTSPFDGSQIEADGSQPVIISKNSI
jgi:hypothetical protein